MLVRAGLQSAALRAPQNDLLLGVDPRTQRHDHTQALAPGDTLLLHTDGLIERRGSSLEDEAAALVDAAGRLAHLEPAQLVSALAHGLVPGQPADDVVLLAAQVVRRA